VDGDVDVAPASARASLGKHVTLFRVCEFLPAFVRVLSI